MLAKEKSTGSTPVDEGTYVARCFRIADVGTQHGEYQGRATERRQIIVSWELPTELLEEGEWAGKPKAVHSFYTLSLHKKANLRHDLENWRGRAFTAEELEGFEVGTILGASCLVTITHTESGRAKVSGVTALPKGMEVPPAVNDEIFFDLDKGWDHLDDLPNSLPSRNHTPISASNVSKVRSKMAPSLNF